MRLNVDQEESTISFSKKMYIKAPKNYDETHSSEIKKNMQNYIQNAQADSNICDNKFSEITKKHEKGSKGKIGKNNFFDQVETDGNVNKRDMDSRCVDLNNIPTDQNLPITPIQNLIEKVNKNVNLPVTTKNANSAKDTKRFFSQSSVCLENKENIGDLEWFMEEKKKIPKKYLEWFNKHKEDKNEIIDNKIVKITKDVKECFRVCREHETTLKYYKVIKLLGKGSFGKVY